MNGTGSDRVFLRQRRQSSNKNDLPDDDNKAVIATAEDRLCGLAALKDSLGSTERSAHASQRK
jgi:hypothetical protein